MKNTAAKEIIGSVGTHGWGGAAGTWFGIDPQEKYDIYPDDSAQ